MDAHHQKPYHYVAIGDSLTVGLGADLFAPGFVGRYAKDAATALQRPVIINKFAKSGATSGEILGALHAPMVSEAVRTSDIITITAGGNDLIDAAEIYLINQNEKNLFLALETAIQNIKAMVDHIHFLHNPDHHQYIIRILNLYNPFPNIPQANQWLQRFNAHLAEYTRFSHIKIADIYSAFQGRQSNLLHGIHPNDRGYEVIADKLNHLGYGPLL
jgi:lysophospholipase L1-like esterase